MSICEGIPGKDAHRLVVCAGTPFDTGIGARVLRRAGYEVAAEVPVSRDPYLQTRLQHEDGSQLETLVTGLLRPHEGSTVLIYCDSLSMAVDWARVSKKIGCNVIDLRPAYEYVASRAERICVLSANAITLARCEAWMLRMRPAIRCVGVSVLPLVASMELDPRGTRPLLERLLSLARQFGSETIVLGCTHFETIPLGCNTECLFRPAQWTIDNVLHPRLMGSQEVTI